MDKHQKKQLNELKVIDSGWVTTGPELGRGGGEKP